MTDVLKEAIQRGARTERWMKQKEVQRVFQELGEDIASLWTKTLSDQGEERERLYREIHGLGALRKRILKIIDDGKKAAYEVEENAKRSNQKS